MILNYGKCNTNKPKTVAPNEIKPGSNESDSIAILIAFSTVFVCVRVFVCVFLLC